MADILSAITPIFAVILVGYLATRFGLFKAADMSILNRFVVKIGLPMLIFFNLAGRPASEIFNVTYLLIYGLAAALVMGLAQLYGKVKGTSKHRATFMGMGMAGTNNGFMGFPIFLAVIPAVAGPAVGMDMIIDNLVTIPITLFIAEQAMQRGGSLIKRVTSTLVGLFTNPLIIAIIAALAVSALKIDVPAPVMSSVELLARTSSGNSSSCRRSRWGSSSCSARSGPRSSRTTSRRPRSSRQRCPRSPSCRRSRSDSARASSARPRS